PTDVTDDISNSGLAVDFIKNAFDKTQCKTKLIFIDTCYSGGINNVKSISPKVKSVANIKKFSDVISGEGTVIFTSCDEIETSIEVSDLEHGIFTAFLLEELQNGSSNAVPISNIHAPVTTKVTEYAKKKAHKQTPTFRSNIKGNILLPIF